MSCTVHAATDGRKTFCLPEARPVYDVIAEKVVSRGARSFTVEIPEHETRIYCLGLPNARVPRVPARKVTPAP